MTVISGWRAALVLVALVVLGALLLTAMFWLAIALVALAAVAWLNLLLLPRLAVRLHVPLLALGIALLVPLAGIGYLLAGVTGAVEGLAVWLLGVALPRALLWRYQRRLGQPADEQEPVTIIMPYRP